ncbi:MAG: hypothetical protein Q9210_001155 [Variospora velana]
MVLPSGGNCTQISPPSPATTPEQGDPRIPILPDNFDTLRAFHIAPNDFLSGSSADNVEAKTQQLLVKTMLIDPYTPLDVYTPILPIKSLQLPAWTVQRALEKMSAFFHLGPLLLTKDIPSDYDPANPLDAETWLLRQHQGATDPAAAQIR